MCSYSGLVEQAGAARCQIVPRHFSRDLQNKSNTQLEVNVEMRLILACGNRVAVAALAVGLLFVLSNSVSYAQETSKSARVKTFSGGILNKKAIEKPVPIYPHAAGVARVSGLVVIHVIVDENGRVETATAVRGHPLLRSAAIDAARLARFAPTRVSGNPVKVSGILLYRFVRPSSI
jgi:TonB family protein